MNFEKEQLSLIEMQERFASSIEKVRTIGEIELSKENYHYLSDKISSMYQEQNVSFFHDCFLCATVQLVFSFLYSEGEKSIKAFIEFAEQLPQHQRKYFIHIFFNGFDEYGITVFQERFGETTWQLMGILARHAGIGTESAKEYFEVLDFCTKNYSEETVTKKILSSLPKQVNYVFSFLQPLARQEFVRDTKELFELCQNGAGEEMLIEKYPEMSLQFIKQCVSWCAGNL